MRTPNQWKRDFYLSIKNIENELDDMGKPIDPFQKPIEFKGVHGINYQPLSSKSDIEMYGASSKDVVKAVIMNDEKSVSYFHEEMIGSLVYLFGASPTTKPNWDSDSEDDEEIKHGFWANYEVDAVNTYLHHKTVFMKRYKRTGVN